MYRIIDKCVCIGRIYFVFGRLKEKALISKVNVLEPLRSYVG